MSSWTANREVLRARFPEVARRVEAARARPAAGGGLASEQAQRLARRWLSGRRIRNGAWLAVSGWGDGAHVQALLDTLPARARLFVAEAEPAELRATCESRDLTVLLGDPRLLLGVGEANDVFFAALNTPEILQVADVEPWLFAPCFNRAPEYYAHFFTEFARQVDVWRRLHGTWVKDAELWQSNTLANLPLLAEAPDLAALRGAGRGLPMVLVSAGPSLDESLDFLRTARNTAVIVAVNSSYRAVRNAGIVPHLVLAADPRGFTARGFAGVAHDGSWLVTTHIVHPEVVRLFGERTFTWTNGYSLVSALRRQCGLPPATTVVEQGTVSACAVDLALVLGCTGICLVGQDLAVREDGRSHTADSFYTDTATNFVEVGACRRLPGNTLPLVPVEEKLFVYLKTFEQLVAHRPQLRFINTARLGVRISGVPYADFAAALRWLGRGKADGISSVLAARHAAGRRTVLGRARAQAMLAESAGYARAVLTAALTAACRCAEIPEAVLASAPRDAAQLEPVWAALQTLRVTLASVPAAHALLEGGRTRFELFCAQRGEGRVGDGPEVWREIMREQEFAWAIAEGAWFLNEALHEFDATCRAMSLR